MGSLKFVMLAQVVLGVGFFATSGCESTGPPEEQRDDAPQLSLEDHLLHAFGSKDASPLSEMQSQSMLTDSHQKTNMPSHSTSTR